MPAGTTHSGPLCESRRDVVPLGTHGHPETVTTGHSTQHEMRQLIYMLVEDPVVLSAGDHAHGSDHCHEHAVLDPVHVRRTHWVSTVRCPQ